MKLVKALENIIDKDGLGIIFEPRLLDHLADYHAFETPAIERIMETLIENKVLGRIKYSILTGDFEQHIIKIENQLTQEEGYSDVLVRYVLDSLLYAINKTGNPPVFLEYTNVNHKRVRKKDGSDKGDLVITQENDIYNATFDGIIYKLDKGQYKAILRKKDMPKDRLVAWLESYNEENN